jgi:hypothetical protein
MSNERIKNLLAQLREEIRRADVDDELQKLMSELDDDIHAVIEDDAEADALLERAKALEAEFATKFPVAERFMREVIDTLARMGI